MKLRMFGRTMVLIAAGAALLFAVPAAEAGPERTADLYVYNSGSLGWIDVKWDTGGNATELVKSLKPGKGSGLTEVDILRGRIEVRLAGAGRTRRLLKPVRLHARHAYCVFVGQGEVTVEELTKRLRRDPSPEKVCKQFARGN